MVAALLDTRTYIFLEGPCNPSRFQHREPNLSIPLILPPLLLLFVTTRRNFNRERSYRPCPVDCDARGELSPAAATVSLDPLIELLSLS